MKFLLVQDFHITGRNPKSRVDNYYKSCLEKLDEIIELSKDIGCVISAGDFFDTAVVSNTIVDEILDRIEKGEVHWFFVYGNHDLINYNFDASKGSSLSHMIRRSQYCNHLKTLAVRDRIVGYDSHINIENDFKKKGIIIEGNDNKIAITHGFITIKPFHPRVTHVQAKDISTNTDLVTCSHFHTEFDEVINGTRFLNINSISRTSIKEQHEPQVAIIDSETLKVEKIKLKSAKKPSEIFDLKNYTEVKKQEKDIQEFLDTLNDFEWTEDTFKNRITKIINSKKVEESVSDYILENIKELENE